MSEERVVGYKVFVVDGDRLEAPYACVKYSKTIRPTLDVESGLWTPGRTLSLRGGAIRICARGYHVWRYLRDAVSLADAKYWYDTGTDTAIFEAEIWGDIVSQRGSEWSGAKYAGRKLRLLREVTDG